MRPIQIGELLPRAAVQSEVRFSRSGMGVGEALEVAEAITAASYEFDHPYVIHLVDEEFRKASLFAHPSWQSCTWCIHLFDAPYWEADDPRSGHPKTATATSPKVTAADRFQLALEADHDCA